MKGVEVTYLIDPDTRLFGPAARWRRSSAATRPNACKTSARCWTTRISTPCPSPRNHWHVLAIWACQAGKDVYVEKPCSHNVSEGRSWSKPRASTTASCSRARRAAPNISGPQQVTAIPAGSTASCDLVRLCHKPRRSIGFQQPKQPPRDWTTTCGAVRRRCDPITTTWFTTSGTGSGTSATGTSETRASTRWTLPAGQCPRAPRQERDQSRRPFRLQDQGQTPNTQLTVIDFGGPKILFEDRGLVNGKTFKVANEFYLEAGVIKDGKFFPRGKTEGESWSRTSRSTHPAAPSRQFYRLCPQPKSETISTPPFSKGIAR